MREMEGGVRRKRRGQTVNFSSSSGDMSENAKKKNHYVSRGFDYTLP